MKNKNEKKEVEMPKLDPFQQLKVDVEKTWTKMYGGDLVLSHYDPATEAVETYLNGNKFFTFHLGVMQANHEGLSLVRDFSLAQYICELLYQRKNRI